LAFAFGDHMKLPRVSAWYVWFWFTHQYRMALRDDTPVTGRRRNFIVDDLPEKYVLVVPTE